MRKKKNTIKEETPDSPMRTCKQVNTHKLRERAVVGTKVGGAN
jgi:hypothetical protein